MKAALVLLLLGGLLFALTTGWGAARTRPSLDPAALEEWQALFSPATPLRAGDLFGVCVQQGTITVPQSQSCQVTVRASEDRVRRARLAVSPGVHVRLAFTQPDALTVKKELGPAQRELDLDVFEQGGKLIITCLAANPCQVKLGR